MKINCANAFSRRWHIVASRFPSDVIEWSGDFLDEIVSARDKRVLRVIAVGALGGVD